MATFPYIEIGLLLPSNFAFSYAIYEKTNSLENITWSPLGKQHLEANEVYLLKTVKCVAHRILEILNLVKRHRISDLKNVFRVSQSSGRQ